jgi:hypothetical protein
VEFVDWIAILLWPMGIVGLSLSAWLIWKHGSKSRIGHNSGLLALVYIAVIIISLSATYNKSLTFLFDAYLGEAFAGLCLIGFAAILSHPRFQLQRKISAIALLAASGLFLIYAGVTVLYMDYLVPKTTIEGTIADLRVERCSQCASTFYADIDGRPRKLTAPSFGAVKVGDHVRAEIGKGSGYVFSFQQIPYEPMPAYNVGASLNPAVLPLHAPQ